MWGEEYYMFRLGTHRGNKVIWIEFEKNYVLIGRVKELVSARWSATQKCWYVTDTPYYRQLFGLKQTGVAVRSFGKIDPINQSAFQRFQQELSLKGYGRSTIRTYSLEFAQLLYALKAVDVSALNPDRIRSYLLYCHNQLGLPESRIHSRMNAIKFYFEKVLGKERFFVNIPRPKKHLQLPKDVNQKEIARLFDVVTNPKHLIMLKLVYGMGLRVSEIVGLKVKHIDSVSMQVLIERGKGKKDRYVPLPKSVLDELRNYYKTYHPAVFV